MSFGDGTYLVGSEIATRTYRNSGGEVECWATLSTTPNSAGSIIFAGRSGPHIISIDSSHTVFGTNHCGTWTRIGS